jgi:hypothetical protein
MSKNRHEKTEGWKILRLLDSFGDAIARGGWHSHSWRGRTFLSVAAVARRSAIFISWSIFSQPHVLSILLVLKKLFAEERKERRKRGSRRNIDVSDSLNSDTI